MNLRPHLRRDIDLGGRFHHAATFVDVERERLLAIDVLTVEQCRQRCISMRVLGRADDNCVDVIEAIIIQPTEVCIGPSSWIHVGSPPQVLRIHIAKSDDVFAPFTRNLLQVMPAASPGADEGNVEFLIEIACPQNRGSRKGPDTGCC